MFLAAVALPACAGHQNVPYSNPAFNHSQYDYAKVLRVQPVTEIVQIPEEQQVCREEAVQYHVAEHRSPVPVIFGSILGGVIQHSITPRLNSDAIWKPIGVTKSALLHGMSTGLIRVKPTTTG